MSDQTIYRECGITCVPHTKHCNHFCTGHAPHPQPLPIRPELEEKIKGKRAELANVQADLDDMMNAARREAMK